MGAANWEFRSKTQDRVSNDVTDIDNRYLVNVFFDLIQNEGRRFLHRYNQYTWGIEIIIDRTPAVTHIR